VKQQPMTATAKKRIYGKDLGRRLQLMISSVTLCFSRQNATLPTAE